MKVPTAIMGFLHSFGELRVALSNVRSTKHGQEIDFLISINILRKVSRMILPTFPLDTNYHKRTFAGNKEPWNWDEAARSIFDLPREEFLSSR